MESSRRSKMNTEVYKDKNTLVEVTIHRRPKSTSSTSPDKFWKRDSVLKSSRNNKGRNRNTQEVMQELRDIVKVSGIKHVQDILDESNSSRDIMSSEKLNILPISPVKLSEKLFDDILEEKIYKLERDCQKYRREAARYKHDNEVMANQVEIGKEAVSSLEMQIVDLKKIISRLTMNNKELMEIVSEKIKYEDLIVSLEQKTSELSNQLSQEKLHSSDLEQMLHSADVEVAGLRSLSADMRDGLSQGLAGLELSRPVNRPTLPPLGDNFKNVCVISRMGKHKENRALEISEVGFYQQAPFPDSSMQLFTAEANSQPSLMTVTSKQPPDSWSSLLYQPPHRVFASFPRLVNNPKITQQQFSPTTTQSTTQSISSSAKQFPTSHRSQSRCSTVANAPSFQENPTLDPNPPFQPTPLDLSETISQSSGIEQQTLTPVKTSLRNHISISPKVLDNLAYQKPNPPPLVSEQFAQTNVDTKVSDYVTRLHQDSLQTSLNIPQSQSIHGPFMLLDPSSQDLDLSAGTSNTSLSEGKFLRGLETSIAVLQTEMSEMSDDEN